MFYVVAIVGILVHLMLQYRDAQTKSEVFKWKANITSTIYTTVLVAVLVYFRVEIAQFLAKTGFDITDLVNLHILWFFIGYFGDSVWKNVESSGKTILKVDTQP